ncbi:MAG: class I SAM-dependent methyltransferase [Methylovulum sp.]|nr:class I SAM-dependent methyltransferase [Methylovulum sp.]
MPRISLVKLAHEFIGNRLRPGDIAIDATVGNGHDTVFLLGQVGASGHVYGFDRQLAAITATAAKLDPQAGITLLHASHAEMSAKIPVQLHGKIRACMFNLGYLPGGDKHIITTADTSLAALTDASRLLATGGIITVIAYPGHPGGYRETEQVKHWCSQLDTGQYTLTIIHSDASNAAAPKLFVICKIGGAI